MKIAVLFVLVAVASSAPAKLEGAAVAPSPTATAAAPLPIPIVTQVQVNPDQFGAHSSHFESGNGIKFHFSGSEGLTGGANVIGSYSYPQADGTLAEVTFVANENGFQPESSLLPVAPASP